MAKIPVHPIPTPSGGGIKWTELRDEDFTLKVTATGTGTYYNSKSLPITELQYDIYVVILTGTLSVSMKSGYTGKQLEGSFDVGGTSTYTFADERIYSNDGTTVSAPISCRIVLVPDSNSDWPNTSALYGRPFQGAFVSPNAFEVKISAKSMWTITDFSGHISIHGGQYDF